MHGTHYSGKPTLECHPLPTPNHLADPTPLAPCVIFPYLEGRQGHFLETRVAVPANPRAAPDSGGAAFTSSNEQGKEALVPAEGLSAEFRTNRARGGRQRHRIHRERGAPAPASSSGSRAATLAVAVSALALVPFVVAEVGGVGAAVVGIVQEGILAVGDEDDRTRLRAPRAAAFPPVSMAARPIDGANLGSALSAWLHCHPPFGARWPTDDLCTCLVPPPHEPRLKHPGVRASYSLRRSKTARDNVIEGIIRAQHAVQARS